MSIIGIVTGASSGLGREFVQRIADGWKCDEIWVIARRKERLEELAGQCSTKIRVFAYDITNIDSIREIQKILEEEKPAVKVLVQAAGSGKIGSYKDLSLEEENVMIDLKRCPFCGGMAEWEYAPLDDDSFAGDDGTGCVSCARCGIAMFGSDRERAEMRWNSRVPDPDRHAKP